MTRLDFDALLAEVEGRTAPVLLSVRNLKTLSAAATPEGAAWSVTLYVDGKRAAAVGYAGWGGPYRYTWAAPAVRDRVLTWVTTLDDTDLDGVIARLADEFEAAAKIKRLCRTKAVYRLPDDPEAWYTVPLRGRSFATVRKLIEARLADWHPGVDVIWANDGA